MWHVMITTIISLKDYLCRHVHVNGLTPESKNSMAFVKKRSSRQSLHTILSRSICFRCKIIKRGSHWNSQVEPRSRIGIYLDYSSFHVGSVTLDLDPTTGLVVLMTIFQWYHL